jgi:hypothetical protein
MYPAGVVFVVDMERKKEALPSAKLKKDDGGLSSPRNKPPSCLHHRQDKSPERREDEDASVKKHCIVQWDSSTLLPSTFDDSSSPS